MRNRMIDLRIRMRSANCLGSSMMKSWTRSITVHRPKSRRPVIDCDLRTQIEVHVAIYNRMDALLKGYRGLIGQGISPKKVKERERARALVVWLLVWWLCARVHQPLLSRSSERLLEAAEYAAERRRRRSRWRRREGCNGRDGLERHLCRRWLELSSPSNHCTIWWRLPPDRLSLGLSSLSALSFFFSRCVSVHGRMHAESNGSTILFEG